MKQPVNAFLTRKIIQSQFDINKQLFHIYIIIARFEWKSMRSNDTWPDIYRRGYNQNEVGKTVKNNNNANHGILLDLNETPFHHVRPHRIKLSTPKSIDTRQYFR